MDRKKEIIMNQEMIRQVVGLIETNNTEKYKNVMIDSLQVVYKFLQKIEKEKIK